MFLVDRVPKLRVDKEYAKKEVNNLDPWLFLVLAYNGGYKAPSQCIHFGWCPFLATQKLTKLKKATGHTD